MTMTRPDKDRELRKLVKVFHSPEILCACTPLTPADDLAFLETLRAVCRAFHNGAGLAAPQIGILKRAAFIYPDRLHKRGYFILNPVLQEMPGVPRATAPEGCLSYPGYEALVERQTVVTVEYYDEQWKAKTLVATGFEAIVIQHEMDHLDGICYVGDVWRRSGSRV